MTDPKTKAIELVKKMINKVYCYMGSGMLTNTYDDSVALHNAKQCAVVVLEQYTAISNDLFLMGGPNVSEQAQVHILAILVELNKLTTEDIFPPKSEEQ